MTRQSRGRAGRTPNRAGVAARRRAGLRTTSSVRVAAPRRAGMRKASVATALVLGALAALPSGAAKAGERDTVDAVAELGGAAVRTPAAWAATTPDAPSPPAAENGDADGAPSVTYPGDPRTEPELVAAEQGRISDLQAVTSPFPHRWEDVGGPYRVTTDPVATLVLPARQEAYTPAELVQTAPDSWSAQKDGSYLVREHTLVLAGATLAVGQGAGATVRLSSGPDGFASIVTLGGALQLVGGPGAPVQVASFDPLAWGPDTVTGDGRAYVRVLGGRAELTHATFAALGFWGGPTGGLAVTGTAPAHDVRPDGLAQAEGGVLPQFEVAREAAAERDAVSVSLDDVHVRGNAFGVFVTNAAGVDITGTTVRESLVDGMVLHRSVTDAEVTRSSATGNAGDGFVVARGSSGLSFSEVVATGNGRDGLHVDGRPLADGPNPAGTGVTESGGHTVLRGTFADNGRYGVHVAGGTGFTLTDSAVRDNEMGVVVGAGAQDVALVANDVTGHRQGIALRDDVTGARVARNTLRGGETGVYVRNATATIEDNEVADVARHGITVVGRAEGTEVVDNTVSGTGPRPIDSERAVGAVVEANAVDGWVVSRSLSEITRAVFQPLTLIWLGVMTLVVLSAVARARARREGIRHPYESYAPLSSFTAGVVDRAAAEEVRA
ncbi:nitrous oxide reductase family maturation protein NosD [Georgenia sp. AZ-5]|uniref:nitrous oxide reductase family maturation protein NosD n=1 Tax=Georgenia sp. AZ-5 TaxID=3367526 RepID=UPI00375468AA